MIRRWSAFDPLLERVALVPMHWRFVAWHASMAGDIGRQVIRAVKEFFWKRRPPSGRIVPLVGYVPPGMYVVNFAVGDYDPLPRLPVGILIGLAGVTWHVPTFQSRADRPVTREGRNACNRPAVRPAINRTPDTKP